MCVYWTSGDCKPVRKVCVSCQYINIQYNGLQLCVRAVPTFKYSSSAHLATLNTKPYNVRVPNDMTCCPITGKSLCVTASVRDHSCFKLKSHSLMCPEHRHAVTEPPILLYVHMDGECFITRSHWQ